MAYRCSGRRGVGLRCKLKVDQDGEYCDWHLDQKAKRVLCKCILPSGSACPYEVKQNEFCEYHQKSYKCQGTTLLGDLCLKAISSGKYCWSCSNQEGVIMDGVKEKTSEYRASLLKQGTAVVCSVKSVPVHMGDKIIIPGGLKKVEVAKPDNCVICLEPMTSHYRALSCGHFQHDLCLSGQTKLECCQCRAPIPARDVPKWVAERIAANSEEYKKEQVEEQTQAVMQIVRREILDMNSSEEEDFNRQVQSGAEMALVAGDNGRPGLIFLQ